MSSTRPTREGKLPGDIRHWHLINLRTIQKGLIGRQVTAVLRAPDLETLESEEAQEWKPGKPPELHVSILGTKCPVVVTVSEDLYVWRRKNGGEMACPVSLLSKALELIIYTVNVS